MAKILVIEDDKIVRSNLLVLLEIEEFAVLGAENGRIGLQMALEHKPDLVISDIMMPELDGYGVLKGLRENPVTAHIPLIFLSARVEPADIELANSQGANGYITKPFSRDHLLSTIRAHLGKEG